MNGIAEDGVRALAVADTEVGRAIDAAADRCFAVVRIQVSGRTGVGKSSVRSVLAAHPDLRITDVEMTEAASIDVPRSPDPVLDGDVVVHVMAGGAQPADANVVASAKEVVPVLAKADTIDDLDAIVGRLSASLGRSVYFLMGTTATSVMRGLPSSFDSLRRAADAVTADMLLTPERFLRAKLPMPRPVREELVEQIEIRGVAIAVDALVANPATDDATLRLLLTERSGADAVARAVRQAVDAVRVDRQGRLLHRLTELAAEYPSARELERFLGSDEAVVAIMRSALRALGEQEEPNPTLDTAHRWHERRRGSTEPAHARAALAVARGYMRLRVR